MADKLGQLLAHKRVKEQQWVEMINEILSTDSHVDGLIQGAMAGIAPV